MKKIAATLLALLLGVGAVAAVVQVKSSPLPGAHLQASISTGPAAPGQNETANNVQPGTAVKLSALVKNIGDKVSHSGNIYVRFAFSKPLDGEPGSVLFETERQPLPPIGPGKEVEITFSKAHQWPSVFDYVRDDWHMRQYEAVVDIQGRSEVIGRAAISISAKYYNGPAHEMPAAVPHL